jgi:hypothetical protein
MVNLLFLIIILAIVLMNGDAVARLATTPVYNFQTKTMSGDRKSSK